MRLDKEIKMIEMKEIEEQRLKEIAEALDREQAEMIVKAIPLDILWNELGNRIVDMNDFLSKFDRLSSQR